MPRAGCWPPARAEVPIFFDDRRPAAAHRRQSLHPTLVMKVQQSVYEPLGHERGPSSCARCLAAANTLLLLAILATLVALVHAVSALAAALPTVRHCRCRLFPSRSMRRRCFFCGPQATTAVPAAAAATAPAPADALAAAVAGLVRQKGFLSVLTDNSTAPAKVRWPP